MSAAVRGAQAKAALMKSPAKNAYLIAAKLYG
jgi:hypothetical protein